MKALLQRVSRAAVTVVEDDGSTHVVGRIDAGVLVLLCVLRGDGPTQVEALAQRVAQFRFFADEEGKMNRSALDLGRAVLVVSQFTLAADGRKGRRPSFDRAAPPAEAEVLYEAFVAALRGLGLRVETGRFAASMQVELVNDGPVTFLLEEPAAGAPDGG